MRDSHENKYLPHFDARWNSSNRWWNKFVWRLLRILSMGNGIHWFICFGICLVPISCFSSVRTLISLGVIFRTRWKPMGFGRMNFFILIDERISFHVTWIKVYFCCWNFEINIDEYILKLKLIMIAQSCSTIFLYVHIIHTSFSDICLTAFIM